MTEIDDLTTPHDSSLPSSSNEHHSPAVIVADGDRQDETGDIGLESMRTGKTATRIACTVLQVPPYPHIRIDRRTLERLSGASEEVLELHSLLALNLVRRLGSCS
jgi:hypothetical protein